jgi:formamidopyrimidine-DNA glycosylase
VPELPETETIARDLDREIRGRVITGVVVEKPDVLRGVTPAELAARATGRRVERAWRRAKLVVIDLAPAELRPEVRSAAEKVEMRNSDRRREALEGGVITPSSDHGPGDRIVVQPRFTGALLLARGPLPDAEAPYSTLHFTLDDGRDLHYRDIRRLGTVTIMSPDRFAEYSASLGIEPLDPGFTDSHLSGILRGSKQAVKKVLMDQRVVVGIGNIYANEACWRAGIDPSRSARTLTADEASALRAGIVGVLSDSIAARGTSFRDYRDASGGRGDFERSLAVYGRGGERCLRCGARLVETHAIDGRTTVLCAGCQR